MSEPVLHILRQAVPGKNEHLTVLEMKKRMPPCPICGRKAYLDHGIVDGFDFGWDAGCPAFCLNDGVHGISESYHPDAPHVNSYSAEKAFTAWVEYCDRMKGDGKIADGQNEVSG